VFGLRHLLADKFSQTLSIIEGQFWRKAAVRQDNNAAKK
jgi:hypothetical protein